MTIMPKGFYLKEIEEFDRLKAIFNKNKTAYNAAMLLSFQANTRHGQWPGGHSELIMGAVEAMAKDIIERGE